MAALTAAVIGGAALAGGASAYGKYKEGEKQADAAEAAARAQAEAAAEQRRQVLAAAERSPQELAAQSRHLEIANRSIARQEKLLEAIDPALIEAGKQAQALLQGKEAGALAPLRQAQAREKAAIEARLREQLGSGFASSSAGIEAITRLSESQLGQQQAAQERTLGALLGTSLQARPDLAQLANLGGIEAGYEGEARRSRLGAISGTPIQADVSQQVGQMQRAQARSELYGGLGQVAGSAAGAYLGYSQGQAETDAYNRRTDVLGGIR